MQKAATDRAKVTQNLQAYKIIAGGFLQRVRRRHAACKGEGGLSLHPQLAQRTAHAACATDPQVAGLAAIRRAHEAGRGAGSQALRKPRAPRPRFWKRCPALQRLARWSRTADVAFRCFQQWKRRADARMPWSRVPRKGWISLRPLASGSCLAAEQSGSRGKRPASQQRQKRCPYLGTGIFKRAHSSSAHVKGVAINHETSASSV